MSLELDEENRELLGFQSVSWIDSVTIFEELRQARVIRGNTRPKVPRPAKCLGCAKALTQNLGSRVRHYCRRKCQRAATRSNLKCACGKPLSEGARVWCSEKCRKASPQVKATLNAARNKRRKLHGRNERKQKA